MGLASDVEPSLLHAELWEEDEDELSVPMMEDTKPNVVADRSPMPLAEVVFHDLEYEANN